MAGKSRQKRSKQSISSRKARGRQRAATSAQAPAAPQRAGVAGRPEVSSPPETISRQSSRPQVMRYPYVTTELRTIGILAAMILIVLIILYFTLG